MVTNVSIGNDFIVWSLSGQPVEMYNAALDVIININYLL